MIMIVQKEEEEGGRQFSMVVGRFYMHKHQTRLGDVKK